MAWETTDTTVPSDSLIKRARSRTVEYEGIDHWTVLGSDKLGDAYDYYTVTKRHGKYACSCATHAGGEYRRKRCSHVLAVVFWVADNPTYRDKIDTERGDGDRHTGAETDGPHLSVEETFPGGIEPVHTEALRPIPAAPYLRYSYGDWAGETDHKALRDLPAWVESFRPHQIQAVQEIVDAFNSVDVVFLDAPTGAGKTLIAEAVREFMGKGAIYSCTTKSLQDQFIRDFPLAKVMKGRTNYSTQTTGPSSFSQPTCADCTYSRETGKCTWCPVPQECTYTLAKRAAVASNLAVLNTSYFLNETNATNSRFHGRELVIIDEADTLEQELMGYVAMTMGESSARKYRIVPPEKVTVAASWADWLHNAVPKVRAYYNSIPASTEDLKQIRAKKAAGNLSLKLAHLEKGLERGDWIYTGNKETKGVEFKPVRVDAIGEQVLWTHGSKFLLMSATFIAPGEVAESLGLRKPFRTVSVPSTFPKESRPVYATPLADVTFANKNAAWPALAAGVSEVLRRHPADRVLVHSVSYGLSQYLRDNVVDPQGRVFTYENAAGREPAIRKLRDTEAGCLVGPSLDRGVDLPHDLCRVIVVAKVPYGNLGDKQVSARIHSKGGQLWYNVATIRSLVQMTGRGMRSEDDYCTSYIMDQQFMTKIWKSQKNLLPQWWKESVRLDVNLRPKKGNS